MSKLIGWYHVWLAQQISRDRDRDQHRAAPARRARRRARTRHRRRRARPRRRRPRFRRRATTPRGTQLVDRRVARVRRPDRGRRVRRRRAARVRSRTPGSTRTASSRARPSPTSRSAAGSRSASTTAPRTCTRVGAAALGGLVLRGLVERAPLGELLLLVDAAAAKLAPGGRLVVCSLRREAWGRDATAAEADLVRRSPAAPRHVERGAPRTGLRRRAGPRRGRRRLRRHRDPRRRMTAVHQFVPTLAPRDAVGRHYLAVQETLRGAGYHSDIYCVRGQGRVQAPRAALHVVHRRRSRRTDVAAVPLLGRLAGRRLRRRARRTADRRLPQHHARAVLRALGAGARRRRS